MKIFYVKANYVGNYFTNGLIYAMLYDDFANLTAADDKIKFGNIFPGNKCFLKKK